MISPDKRPVPRAHESDTAFSFEAYYRKVVEPMFEMQLKSPLLPQNLKPEMQNLQELFLTAIDEGERTSVEKRKELMRNYGQLQLKIIRK